MPTAGNPLPINYGYNWLTGFKVQGRTLENTGNENLDYTRIGFWLLGDGEMDGLVEMYDTGLNRILALNEDDDTDWLHFHGGCDAIAGSGLYPESIGGDQYVDTFWTNLPAGLQPLTYNRMAYYAIQLKQLINDAPNNNQNDASVWADVNPIGLWRGNRCRFFDANGNMTAYGFTRNPAWHFVDLLCRRKLFPEFKIDHQTGAEDLPAAVRARFDFGAIYEAASLFGETGTDGFPRFGGDYSFSQKTTLQACIEQILTCSRSFYRERSGKYSIQLDAPRASVFMFNRTNADAPTTTDADVHSAPSMYTGKFRDLLCPAAATIQSIEFADFSTIGPIVTTVEPHCFVAQDYLVIGNTGTNYDNYWQVQSVPDTDGAPVYQFVLYTRGSNYPASVGEGGLVGLRFSRFKERAPQFQHKAMQLSLGAVGVGIPRQRNKRNVDIDFANCTWDQVARIVKYRRGLELGMDVSPYVTPPRLTMKAPLFAPDAAGTGNVVAQIEEGDIVTLDTSLTDAFKGLYEVTKRTLTLTGSATGQGSARTAEPGSAQFTLRPYDPNNYPDDNQTNEPGWPVVPIMPGTASSGTVIPLADGDCVFFTGTVGNTETFQLPDGCTKENMLCWASPAGSKPSTLGAGQHLHYIQDCDAYQSAKCALLYNDSSGSTWEGDVNYCGIAWRTQHSAVLTTLQTMSYVELTLLGGEKMIFGKGVVQSGYQAATPSNYEVNKLVGLAFPKTAGDSGKATHGIASWIAGNGTAHHRYLWVDFWEGPANVMMFGALNNLGTWVKHDAGWMSCPLPDGRRLAIGGVSMYRTVPTAWYGDNMLPLQITNIVPPMPGMSSKTIQCMPVTDGFDYIGGDVSAHGVQKCAVDPETLEVTSLFYDGATTTWGASASVFSVICDTPTGAVGGTSIPADPTRWPGNSPEPVGGGGGGWGSDPTPPGCTVRGTNLTTPEGEVSNVELKRRFDAGEKVYLMGRGGPEMIQNADWIRVDHFYQLAIEGCSEYSASASHTLLPKDGRHTWCELLPNGALVDTVDGWKPMLKTRVNQPAEVLKIELAGPSHEYQVGGSWTHNVKPIIDPPDA